jgi:isoquinoline 1-oxidoreductase beta subunit
LLSKAAAARWNVDWEELDTRAGFVWGPAGRMSFAELAEDAAGLELPEHLPVRGGLENRLTGQPLPRLDVPAKIDGSARFAGDIRLRDMVYAAVRSGPPGSRLAGVNAAAAEHVPGTLKIVRNPEWVGVVATNWWAAARALNAIQPRFHLPDGLPDSRAISRALGEALESGESDRVHESGDMVGLAPSAAIEPLTATANLTGDRLEIWAPTQAPGLARAAAARAIGYDESQVTLYPTLAGGGYGRKLEMDAIEQAAILAVTVGRPVQLTWPRVQEIERDTFRPAAAAKMTGWFKQGRLIAAPTTGAQVAARIGAGSRLIRPDSAAVAGSVPPYDIPAMAIDHKTADIGIRTGYWRGAAHSYTCFFTECFIDELARTAGLEVNAFRINLLAGNPRLARCLATATSIGGWDGGPPGSGMGLACHAAFGSYIATLVEIEVTGDQRLRVLRAVCAVDCGRVVNPEIVKQQIEGGLVHGISAATGKPIEIVKGTPTARSFADYGLPTLRDAPEVSVELVESEEEPGGITELAVPVAAPAVANAYFSLTGQRVRSLPIVVGRRG